MARGSVQQRGSTRPDKCRRVVQQLQLQVLQSCPDQQAGSAPAIRGSHCDSRQTSPPAASHQQRALTAGELEAATRHRRAAAAPLAAESAHGNRSYTHHATSLTTCALPAALPVHHAHPVALACSPCSAGEKGRRIRELTSAVQKRFNFPKDTVELYAEKVANRGLCAVAQAESLRYKLLGGLAVRRCVSCQHVCCSRANGLHACRDLSACWGCCGCCWGLGGAGRRCMAAWLAGSGRGGGISQAATGSDSVNAVQAMQHSAAAVLAALDSDSVCIPSQAAPQGELLPQHACCCCCCRPSRVLQGLLWCAALRHGERCQGLRGTGPAVHLPLLPVTRRLCRSCQPVAARCWPPQRSYMQQARCSQQWRCLADAACVQGP